MGAAFLPQPGRTTESGLAAKREFAYHTPMKEITLTVERDEVSGWLVASWDAPDGAGGITTQGNDLSELQTNVREAVRCHFGKAKAPATIRLHFVSDPVVASA